MQVSVVTTSMRRRHWMISRSFATSAGSCPSRSQCAKSMQRAFLGRQFQALFALAGLRREVLFELARLILVGIGIRRRGSLARDVRPLHREVGVHLEPLFRLAVRVGKDRLGRALGLADPAVDALVGVDHQHVLALVEAVDGADLDAVHVLALDAVFGDDVGHALIIALRAPTFAMSWMWESAISSRKWSPRRPRSRWSSI